MYTHDVILDKDNPLHRPAYYDLTLEGITSYEGKRVYLISFDCKRPGAFTTGFGYPSPLSAKGKIFVDVNTFAVLGFESLINRQPVERKRFKGFRLDPYGHHLVQTYKEFEGKYFLHYSRQVNYQKVINKVKGSEHRALQVRELVSTDIALRPSNPPKLSLPNIKSVAVPFDADFWSRHNIKLDEDPEGCYKSVGLR